MTLTGQGQPLVDLMGEEEDIWLSQSASLDVTIKTGISKWLPHPQRQEGKEVMEGRFITALNNLPEKKKERICIILKTLEDVFKSPLVLSMSAS